jgi:uncharacterized membrane protein
VKLKSTAKFTLPQVFKIRHVLSNYANHWFVARNQLATTRIVVKYRIILVIYNTCYNLFGKNGTQRVNIEHFHFFYIYLMHSLMSYVIFIVYVTCLNKYPITIIGIQRIFQLLGGGLLKNKYLHLP